MAESNSAASADLNLPRQEEEVESPDGDFAFVRISEFYSPRKVVFDLYLRLGESKYLRIFRAGENYDEGELKAYETERGMRYVYFARSRRSAYILSALSLLQKVVALPAVPIRTKFGVARIMSELYMQELFEATEETRSGLLDQGKLICTCLAEWVDLQKGLEKFLLHLEQVDANPAALSFLTGLFSCIISHRMPWKSRRTSETLLLSCFLCDVGLYALPPEIQKLKFKRMNAGQKRQYEKHPETSFLLLSEANSSSIKQDLLMIVRQHHEYGDGSGYPSGLTAPQTQQLSKLVVLAGDLVRNTAEFLLPPIEAARVMFPAFNERFMKDHPELAAKYDQSLLIQFFKIFSEGGP